MKKLFFIACILLMTAETQLTASEPATEQQTQKTRENPLRKMLMTRFGAFKQYLFAKKVPGPVPTPAQPLAQPSEIIPIIFYKPITTGAKTGRITLINANKNNETINPNTLPSRNFDDVNSYNFSPSKRYLLINETRTEGAVSRFGGEWLGKQAGVFHITRLIDTTTQQEIASFDNEIIMYEFSPDNTSLLIAAPQKYLRERLGGKSNTKGASPSGKRVQRATGEILRYELFDIASKTVFKTFENIQSITYISANELFIQYDDNTMETAIIERDRTLSFVRSIMNLFITQSTINVKTIPTQENKFNIRTEYDDKQKIFTLQINGQEEKTYSRAISYHISPAKKYILIQQESETALATILGAKKTATGEITSLSNITTLIHLTSGKEITTFENIITYEFIPHKNENLLLVLSTQPTTIAGIQYGSSGYLYRVYDTNTGKLTFECDASTKSAYFQSPTELIVIDKNNKAIAYDPQTGISFAAEQQQKRKQITEEILEKEQLKKTAQKQVKQKERQAQLQEMEKRQEEINKYQQELQKYYEESLGIEPATEESFFSRGFKYFKSLFQPTTEEKSQTADEALAIVQKDLESIQQHEQEKIISEEEIEEIKSPAIQREETEASQKRIASLHQHAQELDAIITKLPASKRSMWQEKQSTILTPAEKSLKNAIQSNVKNTWKQNGSTILNLAARATSAGITSAITMLAYQATQMGTGNLEQLDTNALLITFLTATSANLITAASILLPHIPMLRTALTATETNILNQALFAPSIKARNYQLQMPQFRGVVESVIMSEAIATVNTMLEQNGEIAQAIQNINLKQLAFGKALTPTSNALVATVLPQTQRIIQHEKFALVLTEVGWIFFQSALIGGILWSAGLGYAGTSIIASMGHSVTLGMIQGILANLAAITNKTTPGAVLNIASVPINEQIIAIAGGDIATTPQAALTGVLQAVGIEATNFIVNESERSGGLFETLKKGKNALGAAISSRLSNLWGGITDAFATIQEIEPLPL